MEQGSVVWTLSVLEACGGIALRPGRREVPWTLRQRQRVTWRRLRVDRWLVRRLRCWRSGGRGRGWWRIAVDGVGA